MLTIVGAGPDCDEAFVVLHRGRYWLARQAPDGRWYGELEHDMGAAQRFGSLEYVCSPGVRSWASVAGARRALSREGVNRVRVFV